MSVESLITQHIDIWTSAVQTKSTAGRGTSSKLDLYGIKKLRELILELAVRGKLVPQDPNDEPASVLVERIAAEKELLIKEKVIKKAKKLEDISEVEIPFQLPNNWDLVRLGNICVKLTDGSHNPAKDAGLGYPMYSSQNVQFRQIDFSNPSRYVDEENYLKEHSRTQVEVGDILLTIVGTLGRAAVVPKGAPEFVLQRSVAVIRTGIDSDFLTYFFASPTCIKYFEENGKGTAQKGIYLGKLQQMPVPVPCLAEQHRIVAKVDELMKLCDQLEQQTEASITAHQVLVETLLATLTNSKNAEELMENWQRISSHFDTLFTTEESIDQLKQTILQLAVMGKLVPQNPADEPASELLKRIAKEKAQLVKDKKIKKQKALPPITDDEKPFELPNGWEWCRLGSLINLISGQHLKPTEYSETPLANGNPYITGPAEFGPVYPSFSKYTNEKRALAEAGDILITCKGAGLGKLNKTNQTLAISRQLMAIQSICVNREFLFAVVNSKYEYFQSKGVGIAIPGISREDVTDLLVALPPTNEQTQIISRLNEILIICDQLKQGLCDRQKTQLQFTDAIVGEFVGTTVKQINKTQDISNDMKISTILSTTNVSLDNNSPIARLVMQEGGKADAKEIWSKTQFSLPDFYKQLKKEIEAGYIEMPSPASINN